MTEGERTVLGELLNLGQRVPASHIANNLKQGSERVISILNSLATRDLVMIHTKEIVSYVLTDEGTRYAASGLPEVLLFGGVKDLGGKATFDDAVTQSGLDPKTKGIAMNWTRRNGWLQISKEDGTSVLQTLVDEPESELSDVLNQLSSGKESLSQTYANSIKQALERKLISEKITKIFEAETNSVKVGEIEKLLSVGVEGIGVLTQEMLSNGAWKGKKFRPYNVESIPPVTNRGKKHPYAEFNDWLKEILVGMGFTEWFGPYVETEFWNNDTLFVPQDHVAREVQDQFRIGEPYSHGSIIDKKYYNAVKSVHEDGGDTGSIGWQAPFSEEIAKRLCLRAHTTPVSMRYLSEHRDSPQKMFIVDRNFRSENLSARHAQEFNQCEGIIMDKGLTLRDLMGYLSTICKRVGIKKIKFKPGQFPFTEPSVECFAKHDTLGWIEVAPGGIFRPEVTRPLGIKDSVLAWGIGSGRLYMAAMGIGDIRDLYSRDLTWLREKYFVR
ncbi:MAG: phenylalanine--tRNA ligase subunit alpha [Candidatus Thorarchaeota archaeon]